MKFSLFALAPLVGFFGSSLAAPAPVEATAVDVSRREVAPRGLDVELDVLNVLHLHISTGCEKINQTASGMGPWSSDEDKQGLIAVVVELVDDIVALVEELLAELLGKATPGQKCSPADVQGLVGLIVEILAILVGTLKVIIVILGEDVVRGIIVPLVSALAKLLFQLDLLVVGLLILVKELVGGLLLTVGIVLADLL